MSSRKKVSGMKNIKSMGTAIKTPISSSRESSYLELYILDKKKTMLEQECLALDERKAELLKKLKEINTKMKELMESEEYKEMQSKNEMLEASEKNWKTMKVDY